MKKVGLYFAIISVFLMQIFADTPDKYQGCDVAILLDRSGSMRKNDDKGLAIALTIYLIDQIDFLKDNSKIVLIPFSTDIQVLPKSGLTNDFPGLLKEVSKIPAPYGNTDMELALLRARQLLAPYDGGREKMIILITDGNPIPNPADYNRYPEVAKQFIAIESNYVKASPGYEDILDKYGKKVAEKTRNNILHTIAPSLNNKCSLHLLALGEKGIDRNFIIELSQSVNDRPDNFMIVNSNRDFIRSSNNLFPKGYQVVDFYSDHISNYRQTTYDKSFNLPVSLERFRLTVNYLREDVNENDISIQINVPTIGMISRETQNAHYLIAKSDDGRGGLVFERFLFENPVPSGTWSLNLKRNGYTIVPLPDLYIIGEGITTAKLEMTIIPQEIFVGDKVDVIAALINPDGQRIPLTKIEAKLIDPSGNVTSSSFLKASNNEMQMAVYPQEKGKYIIESTAFINDNPEQTIKSTINFTTQIPEPVDIFVSIPYKVENGSLKKDVICFSPLGSDSMKTKTIKNIIVETDSRRSARIELELMPLENREGMILNSGDWLKLTPVMKTAVSENRPFKFNLAVQIPRNVSGDIQNGLYTSNLIIDSEDLSTPEIIPIEIIILIPSLKIPKKVVFDKFWNFPGKQTIEVPIITDASFDMEVKIMPEPYLRDMKDNMVDNALLKVEFDSEEIIVNRDKQCTLSLSVSIATKTPPKGIFQEKVYLFPTSGRDTTFIVSAKIPDKPMRLIYRKRSLIIGIFLIIIGMIFQYIWRQRSSFMPGETIALTESGLAAESFNFQDLFSIHHDGDNFILSSTAEVTVNNQYISPMGHTLSTGNNIACSGYNLMVVSAIQQTIQLAIQQSPLSPLSKYLKNLFLFTGIICLLLSILWYVSIHPVPPLF